MDLSNKRILLVIHYGGLGGAERQALGLSKYLTEKRNCRVDLLLTFSGETTKEFDDCVRECAVNNIFYFGTPYLILRKELSIKNLKRLKWSVQYLLKLREGLMPHKIDVIIPFLNFPSKVSFYLYKMLPSVKFTFWHQLGLDNLELDIFESIAVNNIPCAIGNASNCLDMFRSTYRINSEKLNVLPQYVSLTKKIGNEKEIRRQFEIPQNAIVIGMIAHYRPEKFHDLLLNSFIQLNKNYDNIYLVFLGNRSNINTSQEKYVILQSIIKNNNLETQVFLLSEVKVEEVLSILDIGVLVSRIEGTPNVVMEYMLYSLPVVTTNHPGCKKLLGDSEFLIENNEVTLSEKLNKLILSEELRKREGKLNLEKIKKYDIESYVHNFEVIMNKTLKK
ncbi:glycosyltransferase family 4 protein [Flavobacterium sp. ARAG 55.4]|uniref:glycosyltransferase family 4 protein n=1 Tax=Flavobacterium sp. ARAG 55.4 TaxID=3451357 RepID=UPI003F471B46